MPFSDHTSNLASVHFRRKRLVKILHLAWVLTNACSCSVIIQRLFVQRSCTGLSLMGLKKKTTTTMYLGQYKFLVQNF